VVEAKTANTVNDEVDVIWKTVLEALGQQKQMILRQL